MGHLTSNLMGVIDTQRARIVKNNDWSKYISCLQHAQVFLSCAVIQIEVQYRSIEILHYTNDLLISDTLKQLSIFVPYLVQSQCCNTWRAWSTKLLT